MRLNFSTFAYVFLAGLLVVPGFALAQSSLAPFATTQSASAVTFTSAVLNGTVQPNGSQVSAYFEYGTTPSLGLTTPIRPIGSGTSPLQVAENISGLQANVVYYYRIVAQNSYGTSQGTIFSFTTNFNSGNLLPTATTSQATNINQGSAILNAQVNPQGLSTIVYFEYGTSFSLGITSQSQNLSPSTSEQTVSSFISGLAGNTIYYFRVVAQNSRGTTYGQILTFNSSTGGSGNQVPSVFTSAVSDSNFSSVALNGTVNPNGSPTTAWFEYGLSQSFFQTVGYRDIGSFSFSTNISTIVSNLQSNSTYYYRAVARNQYGTSYGNIQSFIAGSGGSGSGGAPIINSQNVSNTGSNTATITSRINPNEVYGSGSLPTAWIEYGTSSAFGQTGGYQNLNSNTSETFLSFYLSGLSGNTTYYYRIVARNSRGTTYGNLGTFYTGQGGNYPGTNGLAGKPIIMANVADNVRGSSVRISGSVNPNGSETRYSLEYGKTSAMLGRGVNRSLGSNYSPVPVEVQLIGLQSGTTYYYRLSAQNAYGTTYSETATFRTLGTQPVQSTAPAPTPVPVSPAPQASSTATSTTSKPQGEDGSAFLVLTPGVEQAVSSGGETAGPKQGEEFSYTLTYTTVNSNALKGLILTIQIPEEVQLLSSTPNFSKQEGSILTFSIGDLAKNISNAIVLQLKVKEGTFTGTPLLFSAEGRFTNSSLSPMKVTSEILAQVRGSETAQSASLLGTLGIIPGYIWFMILLLIVVVVAGIAFYRMAKF